MSEPGGPGPALIPQPKPVAEPAEPNLTARDLD